MSVHIGQTNGVYKTNTENSNVVSLFRGKQCLISPSGRLDEQQTVNCRGVSWDVVFQKKFIDNRSGSK